MKIAVVGTGYVGLVSGACFAEFGFDVTCIDTNLDKIASLKKGIIPIYEPGLEDVVKRNTQADRLHFTTEFNQAIATADVVFIAVGTPHLDTGAINLEYVYQAAKQIAAFITPFTLVVTKSTVLVGTGQEIESIIAKKRPDLEEKIDFDVASNPEFLREGAAINDFMRPDRVVIGTQTERAKDLLAQLYRPLYLIETPIVSTSIATAEMIKYAGNAFLATKVTFINQIADLCEQVGADVQQVAKGIGLDGRIGRKFLNAGPGYGGSCFPKDTRALSHLAKTHHVPLTIVDSVIQANDTRIDHMALKIIGNIGLKGIDPKNATVAILGVTFKPDTDDVRDAPSERIIPFLLRAGLSVRIYDPMYHQGEDRIASLHYASQVTFATDPYDALTTADAVVILTEWNAFRGLDLEKVKTLMKKPAMMLDFRNIYKLNEVEGFHYVSIGRSSLVPPHNTKLSSVA